MERTTAEKKDLIYLLIGSLYLITGALQHFLVNGSYVTVSIAIAVSVLCILLRRENRAQMILFAGIAALNLSGYFIPRFTWISVLGLLSFAVGTVFTVTGLTIGYRKKGKPLQMALFTIISCALVLFSGFLSLTFLKPELTMSLFGSAIMGSESSNVVTAEQKQSVLEDGTVLVSDVQYDSEVPNGFLDIYYAPEASKGTPTFIFIHGGGYVWGDKVIGDPNMLRESPTDLITTNFLAHGYNVVQMNYALAPEYPFPTAIKQLNRGLRFLAENGAEYGLDMTNVVISGGSAGGNLAGLLVNIQTNPEYAKAIGESAAMDSDSIKGVYFLAALFDNARYGCTGSPSTDWMFTQLGRMYLGTNELKTADLAQTNVIDYVTEAFPPTFISDGNTGTFDEQAFDMYEKLKSLGVDTEMSWFPKEEAILTHGHEGNDTKFSRIMYENLLAFLEDYVAFP